MSNPDQSTTNLNILQVNVRGIRKKRGELKNFLERNKIHVALIQETMLGPSSTFDITNYDIHRTDGKNFKHGSAILIKSSIKHELITRHQSSQVNPKGTQETLIIKIAMPSKTPIFICSVYNSPCNKINTEILTQAFNEKDKVYLAGDFNSKSIEFGNRINNQNGDRLLNFVETNKFILINDGTHTHYDSRHNSSDILDLHRSSLKQPT